MKAFCFNETCWTVVNLVWSLITSSMEHPYIHLPNLHFWSQGVAGAYPTQS